MNKINGLEIKNNVLKIICMNFKNNSIINLYSLYIIKL